MEREKAIAHVKDMYEHMLFREDKEALETLIPELRESEDERIRKWIIDELKDSLHEIEMMYSGDYDNRDEQDKERQAYLNKALAYLEKQKDHFRDDTKMVEQKPADDKAFEKWIDEWWKHNKVKNPDSYDKGDEIQFDKRGFKNFCRGIRNMYAEQKPAEWSEEDTEMYINVASSLRGYACGLENEEHKKHIKKELDWLENRFKSLRPQPKQEWSEEDEKMRCNILNALTPNLVYSYGKGTSTGTSMYKYDNEIKWLKSLRPSWKPSKEELVALKRAGGMLRDYGHGELAKMVFMIEGKLANLSVINKSIWKPSVEQMEALDEYIYAKYPNTEKYSKAVLSLWDELKKLM